MLKMIKKSSAMFLSELLNVALQREQGNFCWHFAKFCV